MKAIARLLKIIAAVVVVSALGGGSFFFYKSHAAVMQVTRLRTAGVTRGNLVSTISATGTCSWKYKPANKSTYIVRVVIAKSAEHTAATTKWLMFKVK